MRGDPTRPIRTANRIPQAVGNARPYNPRQLATGARETVRTVADLVVIDGNPLANIKDLRRVTHVMKADGCTISTRCCAGEP
jgi:hypothetical protein